MMIDSSCWTITIPTTNTRHHYTSASITTTDLVVVVVVVVLGGRSADAGRKSCCARRYPAIRIIALVHHFGKESYICSDHYRFVYQ